MLTHRTARGRRSRAAGLRVGHRALPRVVVALPRACAHYHPVVSEPGRRQEGRLTDGTNKYAWPLAGVLPLRRTALAGVEVFAPRLTMPHDAGRRCAMTVGAQFRAGARPSSGGTALR